MSANYRTGQLIGPYQIQKYLDGGGMGDVYLAWDSARRQQVALKLLKPEATRDPKLVERFRREALVTSQLRHFHLVQVYDVGQTPGGQHYMAMAYVDGGSLEDRLQQYRERNQLMPVNEALYLARRIAEAMAYAHEHGVIHRDLKPGNILLRRTGEPVVTDLGIAAIAGASSLTGTLDSLGTPHYMAPEQIRKGEADARADIYAMGVMLYEMLTGRYPFAAENAWAILNMKLSEMPTPVTAYRADIPAAVAQIIHTCLQPNAAARYPSAQALAQALDGYTYGVGLSATIPLPTPPPNYPQRVVEKTQAGRKASLALLYALLGILAVGLFTFFVLSSNPEDNLPSPTASANTQVTETTVITFLVTSTPLYRPPTQTPDPTLLLSPKGVVVSVEKLLVFQEWQLDEFCTNPVAQQTEMVISQNDVVHLLTDFDQPRSARVIVDDGSCQPFDFIKIKAVNDETIAGWVLRYYIQAIDTLPPAISPYPFTPTRILQLTATATLEPIALPYIEVLVDSINVRSGPSTAFPIVSRLRQQDIATVIGRNDSGNWLQVESSSGERGWLSASLVKLTGELDKIPVRIVAMPPSLTPTITITGSPIGGSQTVSRSPDFSGFCRSRGWDAATNQNGTAYGWGCIRANGSSSGINMFELCTWQYPGSTPNLVQPTDPPDSWRCVSQQ